ncbi:MAG TPA: molybdopterin-dependent oxidoreductase [Anaerolineales bacterium]|nr:molybdopterin-dependent oxidoreductase [Anaerolineales bacterium]
MQMIKRTLGTILVLIYLGGCSYLPGSPTAPSESSPEVPLGPTVLPSPPNLPAKAATTTPEKTQSVSLATMPVTPQSTIGVTTQGVIVTQGACQLEVVTQPAWPVKTLHPNELDQDTGLHMTGSPQQIDLASYRLKVTGMVDHSLSLTYDDLRCMPKVTNDPELVCPGVFIDRATWTGVPIKSILDLAGVQSGATELTLVSADGYERRLSIDTARAEKNFLAYEVNGELLPVLHGFPLRAVFPDMWGSYWIKWLVEIRIS